MLVQANYGKREWLRVDGVPVGEEIGRDEVPSPYERPRRSATRRRHPPGRARSSSSLATDAPLLPHQCERLAQRAGLGIARAGGTGGHTSGDLFIAFATGNRLPHRRRGSPDDRRPTTSGASATASSTPLFDGAIEATEEAIVNALVAAETTVGRDGITAHALPHDRLVESCTAAHGRGPALDAVGMIDGPAKGPTAPTADRPAGPGLDQPTATGAGFSIGTPIRLPYSVHEPS